MPIKNCAAPFLLKLLSVLFVLSISPVSLVATNLRLRVALAASGPLVSSLVPPTSQPPRLLTQSNSTRALALEAITLLTEPFRISQPINFGADSRTRLLLFATDIDMATAENLSAFSADAEDGNHNVYPLLVEYVSRVPTSEIMYAIHLRLNDQMNENGDVLVRLYYNGVPSNRVRVGLGHVGGGLPDDGGPQITELSPSSVMAGINDLNLSVSGSNFTLGSRLFLNGTEHSATVTSDSLLFSTLTSTDMATGGNYTVFVQSAAGISNSLSLAVHNPQPSIASLSPSSVIKGGGAFTLTVSGSGFVQGSVVKFNGNIRVTAFVSATLLTAQILASDIALEGSFPIRVVNPGPGGGASTSVSFAVTAPTPTPSPSPSPPPIRTLSYPSEVGALFPDAYWRFGEASGTSFADSSGNAHTATSTGSVTAGATGLLLGDANKAASFAGASISSTGFYSAPASFSVSMIVKFDSLPSDRELWKINPSGNSANGFLQLKYQTTAKSWRLNFSGDGISKSLEYGGGDLATGRQYNVTITVDTVTKTIAVYQDGGLMGAKTYTGSFGALSDKVVKIGSSTFAGTIDEFAIFPIALSAASIQTLFRAARGIDPSVTTYYASPTGTFAATGTLADPFDFREVLQMPGVLGPGMVLELRGGTYTDSRAVGTANPNFRINVSGAAGNPVIIRPYQNEAVKLDGGGHFAHAVTVLGSYVEIHELEILTSDTRRISADAGSDPTDLPHGSGGGGVSIIGAGVKIINCRMHDAGGAVSSFLNTGFEAYGNIIYNMGWEAPDGAHGPGFYIHNDSEIEKLLEENIVFNNYKKVFFQLRHTQSDAPMNNIRLLRNVLVNGHPQMLRGVADDITFDGNQVYNGAITFGDSSRNTRYTGAVINNRVYAKTYGTPLVLSWWNNLTVTGNELIQGSTGSLITLQLNGPVGQTVGSHLISGNKYWRGRLDHDRIFYLQTYDGSATVNDYLTYPNWRYFVGRGSVPYDSAVSGSTYTDTAPMAGRPTTNVTLIRPNRYKQGRANLIIWNWRNLSSLPVNLAATGLINGQRYEIRNAFNWDGGAVLTGVYNSSSPIINLTPTTNRALRIGDEASTPEISKEFQAFIVVPQS